MKPFIFLFVFFTGNVLIFSQNRERIKDFTEETKSYFDQAKKCWENSEDTCIPFYKKMVESAIKNNECVPCSEIELMKGLYLEAEYDLAYFYGYKILKEAYKEKERIKWELEMDAYSLLGNIYSLRGNNNKVIKYFIEAAKRAEKLGNILQLAIIKANLGAKYNDLKNYNKGISLQKESIEKFLDLGINNNLAIIASNIAGAYNDSRRKDSALIWSKKTIYWAIENKDLTSETAGYYLMASVYEKRDQDSAMYYVNKAIDLATLNQNKLYLATANNIKGNIFSQKNNYPEAKKHYLQSIKLYRELGNPPGLFAPLKTLGLEASYVKDYVTASEFLYEYVVYNDSIVSEDNRRLLHELETKYETEKKERLLTEKELELEKQENKNKTILFIGSVIVLFILTLLAFFRVKQKNKLQQIQKEKENAVLNSFINGEERERVRISQELHDGLAALVSAAKMGLEALPHLDETSKTDQINKTKNILENTHAEIRHISHNLMPLTLEKEGLIAAVKQFANDINDMQLINLTVSDQTNQPLNFQKNVELMLFRIIQELINNILKHSQAKNAEIIFEYKTNNQLAVEVNDDGNGFEGPITSNQGLYSIQQRLMAIGGNFTFKRGKTSGMQAIAEIKL